jgi:hypothetical protein
MIEKQLTIQLLIERVGKELKEWCPERLADDPNKPK